MTLCIDFIGYHMACRAKVGNNEEKVTRFEDIAKRFADYVRCAEEYAKAEEGISPTFATCKTLTNNFCLT